MTRAVCAFLLSFSLSAACGGTSEAVREDAPSSLDARTLAKADPKIREHLDRGDGTPIPIKVYFAGRPSNAELTDLLLTRVGDAVIGQVDEDTLSRILRRDDVERVTYLEAGYGS